MKKVFSLVVTAAALSALAFASTNHDEETIEDRIKPVASVCIEGQECGSAAPVVEEVAQVRDGEAVVTQYCGLCHNTGVAEAPILGNAEQWAPRAARGIESLLETAKSGVNAMPAMGTCMDCSDDELQSAIQFMLDQL